MDGAVCADQSGHQNDGTAAGRTLQVDGPGIVIRVLGSFRSTWRSLTMTSAGADASLACARSLARLQRTRAQVCA
ncbi:hypothetical protein DZD52_13660 [Xanthomonas nasturtii]|uniref:Uncharacterized protein n=1 Tax=Xanthomonas nasturtii TaxID=1843581 RepID=A0A3E1KI22_9XANT|nr:hypothetical protein DZD52_13660 [Xanthomonas nasturtii]